jgi:hypothetical protein
MVQWVQGNLSPEHIERMDIGMDHRDKRLAAYVLATVCGRQGCRASEAKEQRQNRRYTL